MTDVVNKEGRRFGMENLKNVLNTKPDLQPEEVLAEVRHSVMESFSDGAEQYDDITMLCISRTNADAQPAASAPCIKSA